ncbi:MAG TPA: PQQ-binding-like beta-propeller repeat protein [Blastocatellia bacterium]|jgi:outer membrane protein assembly factor BamB|nr:PQQ-binding-like beta-propeller repeat protein [Blastocatellia bacterium]
MIMNESTQKSNVARGAVAVLIALLCLSGPLQVADASDPGTGDWPMWGGTPDRNMVSNMKGLPTTWDVSAKKNVKWIVALGSQTYGNPVVAGGMVFVGTNNEFLRDPKQGGDRGVLMAFKESDGQFLWQATHEKLAAGRVNDWPYQGVCSSPLVEGDKLYYVSNRCELVCLDTQGFRDKENDGPFKEEKFTSEIDADVIWKLDMMEEVGSSPHNMSNASPVIFGDLVYVTTSNGQDESHVNIPSPKAPSIIAVNKKTGKVVWEDNSVGERILHGQWASVTVGNIGGVDQVVHGQGDGWIRGYEALTGKKLWEFDLNPKDSVWPKTRNEVISTAVVWDNHVYIANGQDPEHGEGVGHLYCIDPTKRGDITKTGLVWHYDKIRRTISTPAIHEGLLYYPDFSGFLHCLDAKTGKPFWVHDMFAAVWGSPIIVDGKVYLGDEDGDIVVLQAGKEKKVLGEMNMGSSVYSTPVPANGALFIANRNQLFAIATMNGPPVRVENPTKTSSPSQ